MNRISKMLFLVTMIVVAGAGVRAEELRIGFLNSTSGRGAIIGQDIERGWKLGLRHQGWTENGDELGGVPTRIFYADDQMKPDVALSEVNRFLRNDHVHIVSGIIWSNILMAVQRSVFQANAMLVSANAGATPLAGARCNPLFVSASFVNDQPAEASGLLLNQEGIESVVIMVPNYQAGKDVANGFRRTYSNGRIIEEIRYQLGQTDFQADFARVRQAAPEAVFVFAPGGMGIAFVKQWEASGLSEQAKLYSMWTISHLTLPAIGQPAVGSVMADHWNPDLENPRNRKFIRDYIAEHEVHPSHFAVTAYDAATVIAEGVERANGNLDDMASVAREIRSGPFHSVRGDLEFAPNGFPVQPFWRLEVVQDRNGTPTIRGTQQIGIPDDAYLQQCPEEKRT